MADVAAAAAPVRVSPLIKFGRWSLLGLGVLYGAYHQRRLSRKEAALREIEEKQRAVKEAKLAEEKRLASEREIKELEALAGMK